MKTNKPSFFSLNQHGFFILVLLVGLVMITSGCSRRSLQMGMGAGLGDFDFDPGTENNGGGGGDDGSDDGGTGTTDGSGNNDGGGNDGGSNDGGSNTTPPEDGIIFADDFQRSVLGPDWFAPSNGPLPGLFFGTVYLPAVTDQQGNTITYLTLLNSPSLYQNVDLSMEVSVQGGDNASLVARFQNPSDPHMYIGGIVNVANNNYQGQIWRRATNGSSADWSLLSRSAIFPEHGGIVRFVVYNQHLLLFLNGQLKASAIDGAIPGAGAVGFRGKRFVYVDDYLAADPIGPFPPAFLPPSCSLSVNPGTALVGTNMTVSMSSTGNPQNAWITVESGVTRVIDPHGSVAVPVPDAPGTTKRISGTVQGPGGVANCDPVDVIVKGQPTVDIQAKAPGGTWSNGPISVDWGLNATIKWNSTNASSCSVSPTGWGGLSHGGIQSSGVTGNVTYTITCTAGSLSATDSVTVNLGGRWYQANYIDCSTYCSSISKSNVEGPEGAHCMSGEVRSQSGIDQGMSFTYGCWPNCNGWGAHQATSVGKRCYQPGQKRDNDRTDKTVACYCR